jgi:hypothetical protein
VPRGSNRRGFRGLSEVAGLDDERVRLLALGNWHKLNTVLRTRPTSTDLQRLLALEVAQGRGARANFIERLRSAHGRAKAREARTLVKGIAATLRSGGKPPVSHLLAIGLMKEDAKRLGK